MIVLVTITNILPVAHCYALPTWSRVVANTRDTTVGTIVAYNCTGGSHFADGSDFKEAYCNSKGLWDPPLEDCIGEEKWGKPLMWMTPVFPIWLCRTIIITFAEKFPNWEPSATEAAHSSWMGGLAMVCVGAMIVTVVCSDVKVFSLGLLRWKQAIRGQEMSGLKVNTTQFRREIKNYGRINAFSRRVRHWPYVSYGRGQAYTS